VSHHDAIAVSFLHAPAPMHTNLFVGGASVVDDDVNVVNNLVELMVVGINYLTKCNNYLIKCDNYLTKCKNYLIHTETNEYIT
jgi:hypothetical protein